MDAPGMDQGVVVRRAAFTSVEVGAIPSIRSNRLDNKTQPFENMSEKITKSV
jgi:hypothetical protein